MPANGRRDLIRRLKVKHIIKINTIYQCEQTESET